MSGTNLNDLIQILRVLFGHFRDTLRVISCTLKRANCALTVFPDFEVAIWALLGQCLHPE